MNEVKHLLKKYKAESDEILEDLLDKRDLELSDTLLSSMKYTIFSGGKRLRPVLSRMAAELVEGDIDSAIIVGNAIEMIHSYSLIHDDLPSMDDDEYRRGKLTNHRVYGSGIAILAGDGLLTYAFNVLSRLSLAPEKIIKIIEIISYSAGAQGMVGGQVLDLEAEDKAIGLEEMMKIHRAKTGALFRASILAGAYCGEPTNDELSALEEYAGKLGLTFQIVDDILDVVGDDEKLGKKTGSDEKLNKATYPKLLGLEQARKEAAKNAVEAREALKIFGDKADKLNKLLEFIVGRQS
ncbi:MAG: polyprenyl synthetase family protein [Halanaerobiales bacterium]